MSSTKTPANSSKGGRKYTQRYPRGVSTDFRTLAPATLLSYIGHYAIPVQDGNIAPPSELGVAVANHFENLDVNEEEAIGGFLARLECGGGDSPHPPLSSIQPSDDSKQSSVGMNSLAVAADQLLADYVRSTTVFDGMSLDPIRRRWKRRKFAATQGDQVAAKVTRTDENGSWILAYVLRFYAESETYDVQDEDDTSKLIRLPWNHVMRLSTGTEGWFQKGQRVMAIFPETTSFYRAIISKHPTWTSGVSADDNSGVGNAHKPRVKEVILKFEDDEDADGKTPHRRVPSRYVIPLPAKYYYEDDDDVDLTAPNSA